MNDVQIKHMVERFLRWRLPDNFNPDGGISFKRTDPWPGAFGTNLLDAMQAEKMVRYMVDGMGAAAVPAPGEAFDEENCAVCGTPESGHEIASQLHEFVCSHKQAIE